MNPDDDDMDEENEGEEAIVAFLMAALALYQEQFKRLH